MLAIGSGLSGIRPHIATAFASNSIGQELAIDETTVAATQSPKNMQDIPANILQQ